MKMISYLLDHSPTGGGGGGRAAADIIKMAMIHVHEAFKGQDFKSKMLLQVHDELVFDVYKSEVDILKSLIKNKMEEAVSLSVPLDVEVGQGFNWLEAH